MEPLCVVLSMEHSEPNLILMLKVLEDLQVATKLHREERCIHPWLPVTPSTYQELREAACTRHGVTVAQLESFVAAQFVAYQTGGRQWPVLTP